MGEIHWGGLVAAYLFFAGAGAGALFLAAYYLLSGKADSQYGKRITLIMSAIGSVFLIIGTKLIVLDLTTMQAGIAGFNVDKFFRFLNFFTHFRPESMMSIGSWLVGLTIMTSIAFLFLLYRNKKPVVLAVVNAILSICIASYTSLLLGDISHNFVWSNSIIVLLFIISSLSCGLAILIIIKALINEPQGNSPELEKVDCGVLTIELIIMGIFTYSVLNLSNFHQLPFVLSTDYLSGNLWFIGALGFGVLIPLFVNLKTVITTNGYAIQSHLKHYILAFCMLGGAFCLRYAVLLAGQYY